MIVVPLPGKGIKDGPHRHIINTKYSSLMIPKGKAKKVSATMPTTTNQVETFTLVSVAHGLPYTPYATAQVFVSPNGYFPLAQYLGAVQRLYTYCDATNFYIKYEQTDFDPFGFFYNDQSGRVFDFIYRIYAIAGT